MAPYSCPAPLILLLLPNALQAFLLGVPAECSEEGALIDLPLIVDGPCISCLCKDKQVICQKEACNATAGCHLLLYDHKDRCCDVCKGCVYQSREYRSGVSWTDPNDSCTTFTCQASVITVARIQCHVPCTNPLPPAKGSCCPACANCIFNGAQYREGDIIFPEADPCVTCICKGGSMVCSKRACPVLACPDNKALLKPGTCCPQCEGTRKVYDLKNKCLIGTKIFKTGQSFQQDPCTQCQCQGSTSVCQRESCAPVLCPPAFRVADPTSCCPTCRREEQVSRCMAGGKEYKDGSTWKLDSCTFCSCQIGQVHCYVEQCRGEETDQCPPNHRLKRSAEECCGKCMEDDAVCTVFGDPHYRTFDGRVFNFQGSCKYVLSEDCKGKTFSVRVRNDARDTRSFSWTKTVFFKMGNTKVTLEQHMHVKINRQPVKLPYENEGLTIIKDGYTLHVDTPLGVKLVWDGDSFLEIAVPPSYRDRLCGLCGNYNSRKDDDFRKRDGNVARDVTHFGASWRIGASSQCSWPEPVPLREPLCQSQWDVRIRAVRECNAMKSHVFASCHTKVNPVYYFKSCLMDMCECPAGRACYCEALTAYAHECSRNGVDLSWRNETRCTGRRKGKHARKKGRLGTSLAPHQSRPKKIAVVTPLEPVNRQKGRGKVFVTHHTLQIPKTARPPK